MVMGFYSGTGMYTSLFWGNDGKRLDGEGVMSEILK